MDLGWIIEKIVYFGRSVRLGWDLVRDFLGID